MKNRILSFVVLICCMAMAIPGYAQETKEVDKQEIYLKDGTSLLHYLSKNVKYPVAVQENDEQGWVTVSFTVNKKGKIKNVKAVDYFSRECADQIVGILKSAPLLKPTIEDGKPVKFTDTLNISFRLQGSDNELDVKQREADVAVVGYGMSKEKTLMR